MPHIRNALSLVLASDDGAPIEIETCGDAATVLRLAEGPEERGAQLEWLGTKLAVSTPPESDAILRPLRGVLALASANGCRTIVVEHNYTCHDWQSEHEAFWVSRHEHRDSEVARLHFFASEVSREDLYWPPGDLVYLGFSVLRPVPLGPVGRTLMKPPPWLETATLCTVTESPTLFGMPYEVTGVPFMQQDAEFLSCAHAAIWQAHYVAQHRGLTARRFTGDIASLADGRLGKPRASEGLTAEQMRAALAGLSLPTIFWDIDDLPRLPAELPEDAVGSWQQLHDAVSGDPAAQLSFETLDYMQACAEQESANGESSNGQSRPGELREQVLRSVCRSVNSGIPAVALCETSGDFHAINVVGWIRVRDLEEQGRAPKSWARHAPDDVVVVVCDDQSGAYELVADVLTDDRGRWYALMLPALDRIELSGEAAEERAFAHVRASADIVRYAEQNEDMGDPPDRGDVELAACEERTSLMRGELSVRVQLVEGRVLKAIAAAQGRNPEAVRVYRLARLPKWVWVAEFQDREKRDRGEPCVVAEVVLDTTSPDAVPITLLTSTLSTAKDAARLRRREDPGTATGTWSGAGGHWRRLRDVTRGFPGLPHTDLSAAR